MSQRHTPRATRARRSEASVAVPLVAMPTPGDLDDPVLAAAYECVMDLGLRRTTLSEVARRAGVSRMTLYRRYDDLHRLLAALLEAELGGIITAVTASVAGLPSARSRVVSAVATTTRAVAAHPLLIRVLELDPEELVPLMVDRFGSTQRAVRVLLEQLVAAGQSSRDGDGTVREGDPALLALTVLVAAQGFVFSARVVHGADTRAYEELALLVDGYLAAP